MNHHRDRLSLQREVLHLHLHEWTSLGWPCCFLPRECWTHPCWSWSCIGCMAWWLHLCQKIRAAHTEAFVGAETTPWTAAGLDSCSKKSANCPVREHPSLQVSVPDRPRPQG